MGKVSRGVRSSRVSRPRPLVTAPGHETTDPSGHQVPDAQAFVS